MVRLQSLQPKSTLLLSFDLIALILTLSPVFNFSKLKNSFLPKYYPCFGVFTSFAIANI
jgi:hypothetical protein